jgi:hypothetical protein
MEAAKDEARRHGKNAVTENRHSRNGTDLYDVLSPIMRQLLSAASQSIMPQELASDKMLKLVNGKFLITDNTFH